MGSIPHQAIYIYLINYYTQLWLFCDICKIKINGKTIKNHMNNMHKRCKSCDICGKYLKINKSLTVHQPKKDGLKNILVAKL